MSERTLNDGEGEARLFRDLFDNAPDGILLVVSSGRVVLANLEAERLLGYEPGTLLGVSLEALLVPEQRQRHVRLRSAYQEAPRRRPMGQGANLQAQRRDGTVVAVDVSLGPSSYLGEPATLAIVRDVSVRVATEHRLREAQKLDAVGRLAGGVAHDFNNMMSIILSYSETLARGLAIDDPGRKDVEAIAIAAERAASLTRQLLAFARKQILQPEPVDLREVVRSTQAILANALGEHIQLNVLLEQEVDHVMIDPTQIEQVLLNLLLNARDAMPQGGRLTVEAANAELDAAYAAQHEDVVPGRYVMMAVIDSGIGMDSATKSKIFEPFFTTKEFGKGTGLGLATVFGIVKQSGGHIWVYSEPNHGTTFKVYFPACSVLRLTQAQNRAQPLVAPRGNETVLVAEDDEQLRTVTSTVLERFGYRVLSAENGVEAVRIAREYDGPIDVLLTDVVMPVMGGRETAAQVTAMRPGMKVLFVSGHTENAIVHHGVLEPGIAFLSKPATPTALAVKLREVLDA